MPKKKINMYEARKNFIDKVGKRFLEYKNKGYMIISPENHIVEHISQTGWQDGNFGLNIDSIIYYDHDKDSDNGYYTPISELKKLLHGFRFVHPSHIKHLDFDTLGKCQHERTYYVDGAFGGKWCRDCDTKID